MGQIFQKFIPSESASIRRWLLVASILGITFGIAFWGGLYARKWRITENEVMVEGLTVPKNQLDLGEVWEKKTSCGDCL